MLSMTHYGREYIDAARARIDAQVAAYQTLTAAAVRLGGSGSSSGGSSGSGTAEYNAAAADFEPVFFTGLVHVLDSYFVHRARALELKDGNALNEVRVLCTSLMSNGGRLVADKQIKLDPAKSVLGYAVGDEIRLGEDDFIRLAKAFFAEIEAKFL